MSRRQGSLATPFARSLNALRAPADTCFAIALSGGLDSSVLLRLAHAYAQEHGLALRAFHIHHGLSPHADLWLAHCAAECAALGVAFDSRHVQVDGAKTGVEAAARKQRYAALGALCREHHVQLLLTAQHLDDQAETVLLQLLRGSGMAGLSGMDSSNTAPSLLGSADIVMARPLLAHSRAELEAEAAALGVAHIEDESNFDQRYARNALRLQVMPILQSAFPGFAERFARSAAHAQSAQRVLVDVAQQDLLTCLEGDCIVLERLRALSADRANNVIRHWFAQRAIRTPSAAWLAEMMEQLLTAREGAELCVTHPDCLIRRHRDRLYITPKLATLSGERDRDDDYDRARPGQAFQWEGQAAMAFPAYGGVLHFEPAEQGVDAAWLRAQALEMDFRKGGERLKTAANRPSRSLKQHFQSLGTPAWERERLPVLWAGRSLVFAAGIGIDIQHIAPGTGPHINFRWEQT